MNPDMLRFIRYLDWCPLDGKLWWKKRKPENFNPKGSYPRESLCVSWNKRWAGKEALAAVGNHGYKTGSLDSKYYLAHRVIWLLEYGWWPDSLVDHINGDRLDNRIINLRPVDYLDSSRNIGLRGTSKSRCHGVTWRKDTRKWTSRITVEGKVILLGDYAELSEAVQVRKDAEVYYGFHKTHGRS